jgi:hypothetical protein
VYLRAFVAVAVLAGGQLAEVARGVRDRRVEEAEDDPAGGDVVDRHVELWGGG